MFAALERKSLLVEKGFFSFLIVFFSALYLVVSILLHIWEIVEIEYDINTWIMMV